MPEGHDIYTNNFSHEVAESITCIDGSGIVTPASPAFSAQFGNPTGVSQIGDNEADQYTYRLSTGFLVQSLWSQADQAYVVDDGNSEKFFVSGGVLTINDDQTASANDSIYVSTSPRGGASLVINDQANLAARYAFLVSQATYTLTDNSLTRDAVSGPRFVLNPHRTATIQFANLMSLTLNTGTASNTDNLRSSVVPVTLNAGAADAIIAGNLGLKTIHTLSVNGHGGSLTFDDRGTGNLNTPTDKVVNNVAFTVTGNTVTRVDHIHEQQVIFLGKVSILDINENETFSYANVSSLILEGGPVATTFNIQSTAPGTPVTVIAGANGNTFNVGAGGSVKGIQSVLTLKGGGAQSAIVLDDSSALVRDVVSVTPTQVGAGASDHFFGAGGLLNYASVGALTLDLSNAAADAVGLTPSAVTALFMNGNASQFLTGQGASLDLDLTGVLDALNGPGAPGAGIWTFGNRLAATYSGMASTGPA